MKRQIIFAFIVFILLCGVSVLGGYNLHCVLLGQMDACTYHLSEALYGVCTIRNACMFTLIFIAASAGGLACILLMQDYINYRSKTRKITQEISTPEAAGQGEYGTAHWLPKAVVPQVFHVVQMDTHSELLQKLIRQAQEECRMLDLFDESQDDKSEEDTQEDAQEDVQDDESPDDDADAVENTMIEPPDALSDSPSASQNISSWLNSL